jgi:hypothetical protein
MLHLNRHAGSELALTIFLLILGMPVADANGQDVQSGDVPLAALEWRDKEANQPKLVGMLFPMFTEVGTPSDANAATTFIFKEQVRQTLRSNVDPDPVTGMPLRALGPSQSHLMGAPLADGSHSGAVRLARQNGFQGVVWGTMEDYSYRDSFEGIAVFPSFSWAGLYEDFRNLPNATDWHIEVWMITHDGQTVSAFPPSDFVPLPSYLISRELLAMITSGDLCAEPSTGGACVPINQLKPNRTIEFIPETGRVVYLGFDGTTYSATLPPALFPEQPASAYVGMFFNYARGHFSNAIRLSEAVEDAETSTSQMVHDALLYRAAALFRSGRDGSAPLNRARKEFEFSPAVSQYTVMAALLRLKAGQSTQAAFDELVAAERKRMGDGWFDANGFAHGK